MQSNVTVEGQSQRQNGQDLHQQKRNIRMQDQQKPQLADINPSLTTKIIDHHLKGKDRSNSLMVKKNLTYAINNNSSNIFKEKRSSKPLYEKIQQINMLERKSGMLTSAYGAGLSQNDITAKFIQMQPSSERMAEKSSQRIVSSKLKVNSQILNKQGRRREKSSLESKIKQSQEFLYKSLPQPFINKKAIHSYQNGDLNNTPEYFKRRMLSLQQRKYDQKLKKELNSLQINSKQINSEEAIKSQILQQLTKGGNDYCRINSTLQTSMIRKNRYKKKKLQPLKSNGVRQKMSNNIKDYLSVERIEIKQMEDQIVSEGYIPQSKKYFQSERQKSSKLESNLKRKLSSYQYKSNSQNKPLPNTLPTNFIPKRIFKFKPPFELYFYRDFVWKVGYSNEFVVQTPIQYESKVKFYLGKGNNSNLIKGIVKRRPWFQLTDKLQDAHFVWTQIKIPQYFTLQKKSQNQIQNVYPTIESPLQNKGKLKLPLQTLNELQKLKFCAYWQKNMERQAKVKQIIFAKTRSKLMGIKQHLLQEVSKNIKIHNHFKNNYIIGNKKALFSIMNKYYTEIKKQNVFEFLPLTFHIKNGIEDDEYLKFLQNFYAISKQIKKLQQQGNQTQLKGYIYKHNAWIVKPGENTNRGNGIIVCLTLQEIKAILKKKEKHNDGTYKTYILQKYIQKPLLYKRRKFDIRHYMMISCTNGIMKGYWYKDGYVRTTSSEYTLKFSSGSVHLTNDAVQKQLPDYGKYQKGNKLSYEELNEFIKKNDQNFDFWQIVYPKMKKIASDTVKASAKLMDPEKKSNNFQLFGLDFMIDEAYNVWLIEVNSNPCLQISCPLLGKILPKLIENLMRVCVDPVFVPPANYTPKCQQFYGNANEENKFQLIYDERTALQSVTPEVQKESLLDNKDFQDDDDTFDDDGDDWDD